MLSRVIDIHSMVPSHHAELVVTHDRDLQMVCYCSKFDLSALSGLLTGFQFSEFEKIEKDLYISGKLPLENITFIFN